MSKTTKIVLMITGGVILTLILIGFTLSMLTLSFISSMIQTQANADSIRFKNDAIPTLYAVVNERKVTAFENSQDNTSFFASITYDKNAVSASDIQSYIDHLTTLSSFIETDLPSEEGRKFVCPSSNPELVLIVTIYFRQGGNTTITYEKIYAEIEHYDTTPTLSYFNAIFA